MKNKSLFLLLATTALVLGGCGGGNNNPSSENTSTPSTTSETSTTSEESTTETSTTSEQEVINHQDPFVREIQNPSATRNYDERFDVLADDFSGENPNGTTTGVVTKSTLRVLVDSNDVNEPKSPDASIYKVGTNYFNLPTYDGIGFRLRVSGHKQIKLSNLVLGLRGDDAFKVYEIKLDEALDPDGDALPALSENFQDFIISPQQSIEDANTVYTKTDGTASEVKVLDTMVGIHLFALNEECSAVIEIEEVFVVKGSDRTTVDAFNREKVNKADDTCWWRDSTGFIVQKGVTLKDGQNYVAPVPNKALGNFVLNIVGDTTGTSVKVGDKTVAWASLKDNENAAVSNAVNGAFYPLVINANNTEFATLSGGFTVTSTTEVTISKIFYTDLEVPAPVVDYPTFDMASFFMFDNYNREQSGFNGDWEAAITDPKTIAAGLAAQLSYHNEDKVRINGSALEFDGTNLAAQDYINYKVLNDNLTGTYDYMIMAVKAEDGASVNEFRFNIGSGVTYINQMYSAEGLKVANLDQADYPYIKDGYTWLIIDLAASGMSRGSDPMIDYYYTGAGKLLVDFVGFANEEKDEYVDTLYVEKAYEADAGYDYAGYVYSPATSRYIKLVAETTGTIDSIRFEGNDGAKWFHDGGIKDAEGNVIEATSGSGTYVIDLVASGFKAEGAELGIHVHGDGGNGAISIKIYSLDLKAKTQDVLYVEKTYEADAGYDYAGYVYSPASSRYIKLVAETTGTIDSIRFEGNDGAKWFHEGGIKDANGNVIPATSESGTYIIDLVASGFKAEGAELGIHVHGDGGNGAISIRIYSVDLIPDYVDVKAIENKIANLADYNYGGQINNFGADYLVLEVESDDANVNLKSFRFASDAEFWFKDGALIGADGTAISAETAVTAEGIRVVIDLKATGLTANVIHFHLGGFDGSTGTVTVNATLQYRTNSYGHILATVAN